MYHEDLYHVVPYDAYRKISNRHFNFTLERFYEQKIMYEKYFLCVCQDSEFFQYINYIFIVLNVKNSLYLSKRVEYLGYWE